MVGHPSTTTAPSADSEYQSAISKIQGRQERLLDLDGIIRPEKPGSPWREASAQAVSRAQPLDRGDRKNDLLRAAAYEPESTPIAGPEGSRMRRGCSKVRRSGFPRKPAARFPPWSSES